MTDARPRLDLGDLDGRRQRRQDAVAEPPARSCVRHGRAHGGVPAAWRAAELDTGHRTHSDGAERSSPLPPRERVRVRVNGGAPRCIPGSQDPLGGVGAPGSLTFEIWRSQACHRCVQQGAGGTPVSGPHSRGTIEVRRRRAVNTVFVCAHPGHLESSLRQGHHHRPARLLAVCFREMLEVRHAEAVASVCR